MAYAHLINCMLLCFGPYFVLYRAKNLSDFGGLRVCLYAGLGYFLTTACKMIIMASLLSYSTELQPDFDLQMELNKNTFNLIDIIGIYAILRSKWTALNDSRARLYSIGLGWAFTEGLCTNFFYLILNANTDEFSWKYISKAFISNTDMLEIICVVALVSHASKLINKNENLLSLKFISILFVVIIRNVIIPTLLTYLGIANAKSDPDIPLLSSKTIFTLVLLMFSKVNAFL
eukprot:TRINITY_DN2261_c0_g1_i6.p1 TRINITY_DN2261_c0_g1~~TRINITY_DN2261_c0_g1_i6.p1  ORF type:complete len:232 (-),score=41.35 TRINITY_DN2261_c0_g1_i6:142-837(-)